MRATKNASSAALVGIWMILLAAFVVTILYIGRHPDDRGAERFFREVSAIFAFSACGRRDHSRC